MLKISLINMPFTSLDIPSLALTQLRSVAEQKFGEKVRFRILYLNYSFVHYLGMDGYHQLTNSMYSTGLGEWFFRQCAFPDQADNTQQYFQRYPLLSQGKGAAKGRILAKRMGLQRFLRRLAQENALDREDMVGFTTMFSQNLPSFAMARTIKDLNPEIVTLLGGANCEAPMGPELARNLDMIDYVFSGPSLVSFPQFLDYWLADQKDECHRVRGVHSRSNAQEGRSYGAMGQELPIEVPVPLDYDGFLDELETSLQGQVQPSLLFETSRGCWWGEKSHCTFCGLNGTTMAYRPMPPNDAIRQFGDMLDRYGQRCKHYKSVDLIMPREYLKEVFPLVQPPQGVSFFYEVKADLTAPDMETLGKAGVTVIQPGIEALSTTTLKLMKKGTTAFRNLVFLKNSLKYGIRPLWNLLVGFPGEPREVFEKYAADMPLLRHLPPPSGVYSLRFDRYSPYFMRPQEYGLELSPYEFYSHLYPFSQEALERIAYYFEDQNYSNQYLADMLAWKSKLEDLSEDWKRRWCGEDSSPKAQLHFQGQGDSRVVFDTRSGEEVVREVGDPGLQILDLADSRGLKLKDIAYRLGLEQAEAEREIAVLRESGLIFEENERYLSLVLRESQSEAELALRPPASHVGIDRPLPQF